MKLPIVPPGESAAFHFYRHYYELDDLEKAAFFPVLIAFEWGALQTEKASVTREEAEALAVDNIRYSASRAAEWFVDPPLEELGE